VTAAFDISPHVSQRGSLRGLAVGVRLAILGAGSVSVRGLQQVIWVRFFDARAVG